MVHEHVQFEGKLPTVHITFNIEPCFAIGNMLEHGENIYDRIVIDFPQIRAEHEACVSSALSLHPLNKLSEPEKAFKEDCGEFGATYKISPSVPRKLTMGMIMGYLRKFCLDKDFY